jgi:GTP-binding protein
MHSGLTLRHTIYDPDTIPNLPEPQVAVAGRSNVGKSSLINCLAGRKGLARISGTPGKTRSLNYYWLPEAKLFLVDLPGYGYARCSKQERQKWAGLVNRFFVQCLDLRAVLVLIDSKIEVQNPDLELVDFLKAKNIPLSAILTKADKCSMSMRQRAINRWREILQSEEAPLLFSAKTGLGKKKVLQRLSELSG